MSGADAEQVRGIAFSVAQILNVNARNVNYNWKRAGSDGAHWSQSQEVRLLGLSSGAVAQALNTVVSGIAATQMRSGTYLVDVLVRASADDRRVAVNDPRASGAIA